ncbi:MAG: N-acetylmuramoyl-L-alanine amidase family protein [Candidatus Dormibacteria bacterium]
MRRARLLHVLACAPAAVLMTAASALSLPAVGAASVPPPYVVCIDPGHGGTDPGAIGLDGLVEKNLALDISDRLATLLRADGVTVVMTRTTDASVSIQERSDIANASHADVFLPIYFNAWTTPTPDGSVVLYPYARDIPFAQAMSKAVTTFLTPYGDDDGGIVLRDDWWLQPTMPTATVESLFITNPHDAALLTESSFRQGLAVALKDGVEAYLPGILQRLHEVGGGTPEREGGAAAPLVAPASAAPAASHAGTSPATTAGTGGRAAGGGTPAVVQVLLWLLLVAALLLAVRHRRRLLVLAGSALALSAHGFRGTTLHRWTLRRRRRRLRGRAGTARDEEALRLHPLYEELIPAGGAPWERTFRHGEVPLPEDPGLPAVEVRGRPVSASRRHSLDELPL